MSRLIDADALREQLVWCKEQAGRFDTFWDDVIERVDSLPTVCVNDGQCDTCYLHETNGWISVKDRLPENEQYVLLWTKTGVMTYAQYLNDEPHRPWITYDEDGSIRVWDNVVTHWLPLPEPPKEEKEDAAD